MRTAFLLLAAFLPASYSRAADPPAGESTFFTRARKLTLTGARAGEGYFSPDGGMICFQSEREPGNPFFQIYRLDLATGDTTRVSPGLGKTTCSFIRPGTGEVLFASTHLDPRSRDLQAEEIAFRESGQERRYSWDYDTHFDLFASVPGSGEYTRLTDADGYDAEGAYSPDGNLVVFCSMRDAYNRELPPEEAKILQHDPSYFGEIYVMNADGTGQRRLTNTPGYDGGPFFSPDGRRIVWRRFDTKGLIADVWTMNIDGTDQRRVTDFGSMSWAPFYHPSMKYIVFASNKLGFSNFECFIVDPEGAKEPVRVTYSEGFDGLATFSPDGTQFSWTSGRGGSGKGQIWLAKWNHEAALAALEAAPPAERASLTKNHPAGETAAHTTEGQDTKE